MVTIATTTTITTCGISTQCICMYNCTQLYSQLYSIGIGQHNQSCFTTVYGTHGQQLCVTTQVAVIIALRHSTVKKKSTLKRVNTFSVRRHRVYMLCLSKFPQGLVTKLSLKKNIASLCAKKKKKIGKIAKARLPTEIFFLNKKEEAGEEEKN